MNHIYRLVWSKINSSWIAVAESSHGQGKKSIRKLLVVATVASTFSLGVAYAEPLSGQVTAGAGVISQTINTTTINQTSQNLSLSWDKFNVAPHEVVNFVQPNSAAIAVNRIYDTNGSQILGQINANGKIYLINPNGILFGLGAQINVGGLIASTLNMSDASLNSAIRQFGGNGVGSVINQGTINTPEGGYVAFLGNMVSNQGFINAPLGTVALGAGSAATLTFDNNSLVQLQIDQSTLNNLAANKQLIKADGGMVIMSAGAKDSLLASVVNNTGVIEAQTLQNIGGKITLLAGMVSGTTNVGGTLDASAPNGGIGGLIETSASIVNVSNSASVSTLASNGKSGTWTIDPKDFTIAATGGNITGTVLAAQLAGGSVSIISSTGSATAGSGDINVNDNVNWTANELSLTAAHSINVNAQMNAGGTSSLVMKTSTANGSDTAVAGGSVDMGFNANGTFSGSVNFGNRFGTGLLTVNNNAYTIINNYGNFGSTTSGDFQAIGATGYYALGNNLTATGISTSGITAFTGVFNGLGHTITGVNITSAAAAGLFGTVGVGSYIQNIGLIGGSVQGGVNSGGLIGWNYGAVSNTYNTGTVASTGGGQGGLIGKNENGNVTNSYATGAVSGAVNIGGLIGENMAGQIVNDYATGNVTSAAAGIGGLVGYSTTGSIINSYATGDVTGATGVGGLLGGGTSGNVTNSHATGAVLGTTNTGGLVGSLTSGIVSGSYATGAISGTTSTGGLVGLTTGAINTSYATGTVMGSTNTGGLVANSTGSVDDSYATGSVTGSAGSTGGLIGITTGTTATSYETGQVNTGSAGLIGNSTTTVTSSYFNKSLNTGVTTYGTGLSTAQMLVSTNYVGFSIAAGGTGATTTWLNYDGVTIPLLTRFLTPVVLSSSYSGPQPTAFTNLNSYTSNITIDPTKLITTSAGLTLSSTSTAGNETALLNGFSSTQQGYNITYAPTTITGTGSLANDLNISVPIYWTTGNLILNAQNNINFNAQLSNSAGNSNGLITGSTAKLTLNYGLSAPTSSNPYDYVVNNVINLPGGQNFTTTLGSDGITKNYMVVTTLGVIGDATTSPALTTLQGMAATSNLGGNFVLGNNVDASATANLSYNGSAEFAPIGKTGSPFTGYFDGLGHTITNLNLNLGATANAGLFGLLSGVTRIQNVGIVGGNINGGSQTGSLVGYNDSGLIRKSYNTANVTGAAFTGGLVGQNFSGNIDNSYSTGIIIGAAYTGGLVGGATTGNVSNSYATGSVHGAAGTGGLVGTITTGTVSNSYATGNVLGGAGTGGLVGTSTGPITTSYAAGQVTGTVEGVVGAGGSAGVGGLVGTTTGPVTISYASGAVSGGAGVGGLIGRSTALTLNTYSTGAVTANSNAGGLIGDTTGNVQNSYAAGVVRAPGAPTTTGALLGTSTVIDSNNFFNSQSNPGMVGVGAQSIVGGVTGMTSANMMLQPNFTSSTAANSYTNPTWDFSNTWIILPGTMPFLQYFMKPITITANSGNAVYSGLAYSETSTYSITPTVSLGTLSYSYLSDGVTTTSASNAGTYVVTPSGILSNQQYLISFVGGNLTITPAPLTITASNATKVYGDTATLGTTGFTSTGLVSGESISAVALSSTGAVNTASVASYGVTASAPTGGGAFLASNYNINTVDGTLSVTPATLTVTANDATKVYGAATPTLSNTITGFKNTDTTANATTGTATPTTATTVASGVSSSVLVATPGNLASGNYVFSYVNGTLSITPAALSVTTDASTKVYGAALPTFSSTVVGLVNGDTFATTQTTTATSASNVGIYTVDSHLTANANYLVSFVAGQLTVTPATLTITADNATKVTGAVNPTLTGVVTGLVNGDTLATATTGPTVYATLANTASPVGGFAITSATPTTANYTVQEVDGILSVTPATLIPQSVPHPIPANAIVYLQSSAHSSLKIVQDKILCPAVSNTSLGANANVNPSAVSNKCTTTYWNPSLQIFNGGVLLPPNGAN